MLQLSVMEWRLPRCFVNSSAMDVCRRSHRKPNSSDSVTADLTQHTHYGTPPALTLLDLLIKSNRKITMDMVQATGPGAVPEASTISSGVTLNGKQYIKNGDDFAVTHGYAMEALLILFTPLLMLHVFSGARFRWINYTIFDIVAVVGLAAGFYDSTIYTRVCSTFKSLSLDWEKLI